MTINFTAEAIYLPAGSVYWGYQFDPDIKRRTGGGRWGPSGRCSVGALAVLRGAIIPEGENWFKGRAFGANGSEIPQPPTRYADVDFPDYLYPPNDFWDIYFIRNNGHYIANFLNQTLMEGAPTENFIEFRLIGGGINYPTGTQLTQVMLQSLEREIIYPKSYGADVVVNVPYDDYWFWLGAYDEGGNLLTDRVWWGQYRFEDGGLYTADFDTRTIVELEQGPPIEEEKPFSPNQSVMAKATLPVKPSGMVCEAELYLGEGRAATSGRIPFTSTGASQSIQLPIVMPPSGSYQPLLDIFTDNTLIGAFYGTESVVIKKFGR